MKYVDYVGIDVSKKTLDVSLHKQGDHRIFSNNNRGFVKLTEWLCSSYASLDDLIICFEHTGLYSEQLSLFAETHSLNFVLVCGLQVKRSMGIHRGKSDKIDSRVLAGYIYKNYEDLPLSRLPGKNISKLKKLASMRRLMVKQRTAYKSLRKEKDLFEEHEELMEVVGDFQEMIQFFSQKIKRLDSAINSIVKTDPRLEKNMELACSIKGIGQQTALYMLIVTENFTKFDRWRKFACYAGTAPFEHQSGTSINKSSRVSHLADKKIKALLSTAAASAIQYNPEMKNYYNTRIEKGKNKKSTLNIIKNKLISRVFAVISRQTPYVLTQNYLSMS